MATAMMAAPAAAQTTTTFTVQGDGLVITEPVAANLGAGTPGTTITGNLGTVDVADNRAATDPSWAATVVASDFTTGGGGAGEVVVAGSVTYASGTLTTTGDGTFTPSAAAALDNTTPAPAASHAGGTGNNTASWDPTLVVTVAQNNVAGTYTGTVTHSVA
jgi:hypothetical protein